MVRWQLGDNGDGRWWWTITTDAGEIVAQAIRREDADRLIALHNAAQAAAPADDVRAAAERLLNATNLADDSLTDFEADVKTVARAVLAG